MIVRFRLVDAIRPICDVCVLSTLPIVLYYSKLIVLRISLCDANSINSYNWSYK